MFKKILCMYTIRKGLQYYRWYLSYIYFTKCIIRSQCGIGNGNVPYYNIILINYVCLYSQQFVRQGAKWSEEENANFPRPFLKMLLILNFLRFGSVIYQNLSIITFYVLSQGLN